jgi:hypothetical protein
MQRMLLARGANVLVALVGEGELATPDPPSHHERHDRLAHAVLEGIPLAFDPYRLVTGAFP